MELFSKRYTDATLLTDNFLVESHDKVFLDETLRYRLEFQLKHIVKTGKYLEPFLHVYNKDQNTTYLDEDSIRDISTAELGYDMLDIINPKNLTLKVDENKQYSDFKFFDLIEISIIFSKEDIREDIISRYQIIFDEEDSNFYMNGFMIMSKRINSLRSVLSLVKDKILMRKIESYYDSIRGSSPNYQTAAKISAELVQYVFSSDDSKKDTKKYSEDLCEKIAFKWTQKDNSEQLKSMLSDEIKKAKDMNNQISNIRHIEKFTIPVEGDSMYKLIALKNFNLVDLTIQSLPENFLIIKSAQDLKKDYLERYSITKDKAHVIEKPKEVKVDDIPF